MTSERRGTGIRLSDEQRTASAVLSALSSDLRGFAAGAEAADDLSVLVVRWIGPRGGA